MKLITVNGHQAKKGGRIDKLAARYSDPGLILVTATDGDFRDRASALMPLKAARKFANELLAMIAEAEALEKADKEGGQA